MDAFYWSSYHRNHGWLRRLPSAQQRIKNLGHPNRLLRLGTEWDYRRGCCARYNPGFGPGSRPRNALFGIGITSLMERFAKAMAC